MSGRVLVTGGAGFIGSHIAEAYLAAGWEVVVLDDLSRGHQRNIPSAARFVRADIRSPEARELLATGGFTVLNHHAAQIDVRVSVDQPALRRGDQPGRVHQPARWGRRRRGAAGGLRQQRRRGLRRSRGRSHPGDGAQAADLALWREQTVGRVLPPRAGRAARLRGRRDALRQRLRPAAGSRSPRPAWSPSSCPACSRSSRSPSSATAARPATTSS